MKQSAGWPFSGLPVGCGKKVNFAGFPETIVRERTADFAGIFARIFWANFAEK